MGQRNKGFGSRFCKSCKDGRFYILNTETFEWQHVKVPLITSRAYHSTTCISSDLEYVIALIGGVNDTTWIQCDKCKKLYHTHCINLDKVPDGQYF